jgi:hypothetical protein
MRAVLISALVALVFGAGTTSFAFAQGGADSAGQGTRPDVLGSRVDGVWQGPYARDGLRTAPYLPYGYTLPGSAPGYVPPGCTRRSNGTYRCR